MPELPFDTEVKRKKQSTQLVPSALGKPGGWTLTVIDGAGGFDWRHPPGKQIIEGTGSPNTLVSARRGQLYDDLTTPGLWINTDGETAWDKFGAGSGTGATDLFVAEDDPGVALDTSAAFVEWVPATDSPPYVAGQPGNLIPVSPGGNDGAEVQVAGHYHVVCFLAATTDTDTDLRVIGGVAQVGTGHSKAIDVDIVALPVSPYAFGGRTGRLSLVFEGEVGDFVFVQATLGAGDGFAKMAATALSVV